MADPRKIINPETGRPLSEERLSVLERRLAAEEYPLSEADTVAVRRGSPHGRTARGAIVEVDDTKTKQEIVDELRKALFGDD
jgi:hypothetical protein